MASKQNVDEPQLPRISKKPKRFDDGKSDGDFYADPNALYRQGYYEVIDFILAAIQERFDQPGYTIGSSLDKSNEAREVGR